MRIASPERWWRAATAPLIAGLAGWLAGGIRPRVHPGPAPGLPLTARIAVTCLAVAVGVCLAVLIMRTHLTVDDEGLTDHRVFKVVRVPWPMISGFEVGRPRAMWGGFCVIAVCRDETTIDLMSTRAYSRVPSAQHLEELTRICGTLEEAATKLPG